MPSWTRDFSLRSNEREIMDDPDTPLAELRGALDELALINRLFGGYGPSIKGVRSLMRSDQNAFSLLDVGAGGGDMARRLYFWAAAQGLDARIQGIDLSPAIVERARRRCEDLDSVHHRVQDLMSLEGHEVFDISHCAIVLHHLDDQAAAAALEKMFAVSRWGLVVNDLHRHPVPYYFIRTLTRLLSRNRMIRNDGPLSVRRAFRRHELETLARQAGLPEPQIEWHWGFRWLMVVAK